MKVTEIPVGFRCEQHALQGIIHKPQQRAACGVLVVVGGPQYRVGSHRQFLLLARYLADHGIPVMRFDYRGMGDSEGELGNFESIDEDINEAINKFVDEVSELKEIVLWGLCDAASAISFYGYKDKRVTGLVLLNPWVRTQSGAAKTYLKHYYISRLFAASFWRKLLKGKFNIYSSLAAMLNLLGASIGVSDLRNGNIPGSKDAYELRSNPRPLPNRMLDGLVQFDGKILFILSGNDLTAEEFRETVRMSRDWQRLFKLPTTVRYELPGANHTFATAEWREQVARWTLDWLRSLTV